MAEKQHCRRLFLQKDCHRRNKILRQISRKTVPNIARAYIRLRLPSSSQISRKMPSNITLVHMMKRVNGKPMTSFPSVFIRESPASPTKATG